MVNGESHYFLGRRYRLRVIHHDAPGRIALRGNTGIDLYARPEHSAEHREQILLRWYREQLKALIPQFLEKWQTVLEVQTAAWGIKKMKTRWGSCNVDARRVWFNLELAKKPVQSLEYVVVHELAHLLERHHTDRFRALLDAFLPSWRTAREELKRSPLSHERWQK